MYPCIPYLCLSLFFFALSARSDSSNVDPVRFDILNVRDYFPAIVPTCFSLAFSPFRLFLFCFFLHGALVTFGSLSVGIFYRLFIG